MNVKGFVPEAKMGGRQSLDLADEQSKIIAVVKKTMKFFAPPDMVIPKVRRHNIV